MHLGDNTEEQDPGQLDPIQYWVNNKTRKVACSRGPNAAAERLAKGFTEVNATGFHGFIKKAQSTHRRKGRK